MEALTQAIDAKLQWCYRQAEARLGRRFPYPEVGFTLRGMSAGAAHLADNRLRFNPVLLQENPQAFVDEVVPHEVAHLLVWQLHGRVRPHGPQWQRLMAEVFDCPPRTRHSFDVSSVKPATFAYRCGCQSHPLTLRRHNKVQRGQANYQCRRCGQTLTPA